MSSLIHNREAGSITGGNSISNTTSSSSTSSSSSSPSSSSSRIVSNNSSNSSRNRTTRNTSTSMGLKNFIAKNINLLILVTIISLSIYTLLSLLTPSSLIWVFALIAVAGTFLQIWYGFRYTTRIIEVNGQYHIYPANGSNLLFNNSNNSSNNNNNINNTNNNNGHGNQNRMFLSNSRFSHLINPPLNLQLTFIDRDFDSNDYDMLLALDDDNQNYGGAKKEQIDLLPLHSLSSKKDLESLFNSGCMDFCKTEIKEKETKDNDEADTSSSSSKKIDSNIDDSNNNNNFNHSQKDCSICLDVFKIGDSIRTLPCLHHYHRECIDQWLKIKSVCPVCKLDVF